MDQLIQGEFWKGLLIGIREWLVSELPGILVVIVIMVAVLRTVKFLLKRLKKTLIKRAQKREQAGDAGEAEKRITTLVGIIHGAARVVIWTMVVMIVLEKFGVDIGPILASAGIIGLAVGFGAQELVRDVISGFFILLEDQIRIGDVAIINGTGGLVEKIELRTITLRDFSGVVHIVQNGKISSLSNMTKDWSAMIFDIGVAYKEDVQAVMDIMQQVGDGLQQDPAYRNLILEPIEVFGLNEFADSALVIKARIKTRPSEQWTVGRAYRQRLKKAFDERGIEIPFPHTTVYWGEKIDPLRLDLKKENQA